MIDNIETNADNDRQGCHTEAKEMIDLWARGKPNRKKFTYLVRRPDSVE